MSLPATPVPETNAPVDGRDLAHFQKRLNLLAASLIVLVALVYLLQTFATVLQQLLVAVFIVYLIMPPYYWLVRRGFSPLLSRIILPVLLSLVQFEAPVRSLVILALLVLAQATIAYLIEPRLAGKKLDLSPFVIILALAFWGALWGIVGMILAVPLVVTTNLCCGHRKKLQRFSPPRRVQSAVFP